MLTNEQQTLVNQAIAVLTSAYTLENKREAAMKLNINNVPTNEASLTNERKKGSAELAKTNRRDALFKKLFFAGATISLALNTLLWSLGLLSSSMFAAAFAFTSLVSVLFAAQAYV